MYGKDVHLRVILMGSNPTSVFWASSLAFPSLRLFSCELHLLNNTLLSDSTFLPRQFRGESCL